MAGIYFHIPFCKTRCIYCDFYSTTNGELKERFAHALCKELEMRRDYLQGEPVGTIYFGGGTPSQLNLTDFKRIFDTIGHAFDIEDAYEITLEANPETVTPERLAAFRRAGVNRLSLGIQTARDDSLARLGRRHTAAQSRRALGMAVQAGFTDISGDLMLALPAYTMAELDETIALLAESGCTHISGYLLKIEPNTVFGKRPPEALPGDDAAADFYLAAVEKLAALGYAQYEISNFARPGFESRHNRIYWDCGDYLGLGPAAHSCMGGKRFATPAGTAAFLAAPAVYEPQGECTAEDYIMLQLRLSRGLSLSALRARYGVSFSSEKLRFLQTLAEHGLAVFDGSVLRLTPRGMLVQNSILCELV